MIGLILGVRYKMLNLEAFRDVCNSACIEKDPAKLENIEDALRFMLRTEKTEMYCVEKHPGLRPN
jgi:hypothetical protein